MSQTFQIIRGCLLLVGFAALMGWLFWRWLKNSHDPAFLLIRWLLSAVILGGLAFAGAVSRKQLQAGDRTGAMIVLYSALGGVTLAVLWVPVVTAFVGRFVGSLFDGGNQEVEAKPFYSIFRAKRSKGKYFEALAEVRRQLDRYPGDFEGQILLAELQAENLNDLPGAAITIDRLCQQPAHPAASKSYALNKLADWHLSLTKDRDAAQQVLEKIIELFPDTEMALRAAQRLGHLAGNDMLLATADREQIEVRKGVKSLGLQRGADGRLRAPEVNQEKLAAEYAAQLESHPLDTHAREQLAVIYAKHYHRLDLALEQLEQMVQQPGHPAKQVVHWLNLMADLQVAEGASLEATQATLQRVVDSYPDIAAAQSARRRMDMLKLELKGREKGRELPIGVYEQNLGLKRKA